MSEAEKWKVLQDMFRNITALINKKFPGVPILPVFGNNDLIENYQVPGYGDITI
jgi:hypothetical protein